MPRARKTGKYKSALESKVASLLGRGWEYEGVSVDYIQRRKYVVDFSPKNKKNKIYVEVKAFFRPGDISKYKAVKEALDGTEYSLVFVLAAPNKKVRKGAKSTMADWCEKNGFKWYSVNNLGELK